MMPKLIQQREPG